MGLSPPKPGRGSEQIPTALYDNPMVRNAFRDPRHGWLVLALIPPLAAGLAYFGVQEKPHPAAILGLSVAAFVAVMAGLLLLFRRSVTQQMRWLRNLPFALNLRGYLRQLGREYPVARVRVEVVFAEAVPKAERDDLDRVAAGTGSEVQTSWTDDAWAILSPELRTFEAPSRIGGLRWSRGFHTNQPLHRWFRRMCDDVLVGVHGQRPMANVRVEVK